MFVPTVEHVSPLFMGYYPCIDIFKGIIQDLIGIGIVKNKCLWFFLCHINFQMPHL